MVDRRNPAEMKVFADRLDKLEADLIANTKLTKETHADVHRNVAAVAAMTELITETAAKAAVTADKAGEAHAMTVEIRDLLRVGKMSVVLIKGTAAVAGAIAAIGAAIHLWPK